MVRVHVSEGEIVHTNWPLRVAALVLNCLAFKLPLYHFFLIAAF